MDETTLKELKKEYNIETYGVIDNFHREELWHWIVRKLELAQLNKLNILQAEGSAGAEGAAVGKEREAKGVRVGKDNRNLFEGFMDADLGRE